MKKLLPYLFICLYSAIILKPVMPYITDGVAHILNFQGHMATVHAHHGKYHVHTEITEAAKNQNSEKNTNTLKKEASENEYIFADEICVILFPYITLKYFTALTVNTVSIYLSNDFPPPRA